ncbi:MAG: glutamate ABC transporter substrate-binding protein [Chloroflexi bacterium]|nr:glutamate ABC transporter substrate-binding protein [Chloroflexota bacterium]
MTIYLRIPALLIVLIWLAVACAPAQPAAPAKPAEPAKPAAPAPAPAAKPAEPAKPAQPAEAPKPAPAEKPAAQPAAKPAEKPAAAALPKPGEMPAGTYMKTIQDRGKLVAGVKTDVLLFGYLNPRSNKIEGFDVDMAKEIARAIFGDPEKIELKEVTSAARIPALKEGIVDVVVATMTITKQRMEEIEFADVYYESGQQVLVPKNSPIKSIQDTAGKRVCAAKGSTSERNISKFQAQATVVQTDKYPECLLAVQQGRADAISTDDVILMGLVEQDPNMQIVGDRFTQEPYGIGIAKGRAEFVQFVNAVLAQAKQSSRWKEIHQKWLGKYVQTPNPPTRTAREAAQ